jgi:hypothetical protein
LWCISQLHFTLKYIHYFLSALALGINLTVNLHQQLTRTLIGSN